MPVGMLLTMYDKGAPKSVPNVHRIPMSSIPKFGQLRGTSPRYAPIGESSEAITILTTVCICKASEAELEFRYSVFEPEIYTDLHTKNLPLRNGPDRWLEVRLSEPEPV